MKTNKSLKKRVQKITKKGKVLVRKAGHGHFNAKQTRQKQLGIKGLRDMKTKSKAINRLLPKDH